MTASSPCRTPSASQRGEVLGGLRHPALVGGDDEQHGRHRADAGQHGRHEPLVARHVDERHDLAAGQRRPGEAEVDGHAPAPLLGRSGRAPCRSAPGPASTCRGRRARRWRRRACVGDPAATARTAAASGVVVGRRDAAQVEQQPAALDPADAPAGRRRAAAPRRSRQRHGAPRAAPRPGAPPPPTTAVARHGLEPATPAAASRSASALGPPRAAPRRRRAAPPRSASPGRRSVASSAARVSLSTRSARASGCRRSRSTRSARPSSSPACGPPSSLSPLAVTRSAPAAQRARRRPARPAAAGPARAARSRCRRRPGRRARPARATATAAGEPRDDEVRRVHLEHEAGLAARSRPRSRPACVRLVVPTSRSRAPVDVSRSGSRKPSPISTSSPRLTTISRPGGQRGRGEHERRGAVVDHVHRLGGGHGGGQRLQRAAAAPGPPAGGEVELDVGGAGGGHGSPRRPRAESGARPRLVCSTTPVAFSTGRRRGGAPGSAASAASHGVRRPDLPGTDLAQGRGDRGLDRRPAQSLVRGGESRVGEHGVRARDAATGVVDGVGAGVGHRRSLRSRERPGASPAPRISPGAPQDRGHRRVDVGVVRRPVGDRDAASPPAPARRCRSASPCRRPGPARRPSRALVVVAEAHEHLVEDDLVEHLDAVGRGELLGEAPGAARSSARRGRRRRCGPRRAARRRPANPRARRESSGS